MTQAYSGCATTDTKADTVYIAPMPTVAISGTQDVCEGEDNVTLVANLNDSIENVTYQYTWRANNVNVYDGKTYTGTKGGDSTFTYVVIVTDATRGCSATSDPFEVNVHKAMVVAFLDTVVTICDNGQVTLTPTINDANISGLTYQWYKGEPSEGTAIHGATEWSYTTADTITGDVTYYFVATQTASGCADTASVKVVTKEIPSVTVEANHNNICYGGQVQLTAHAEGGMKENTGIPRAFARLARRQLKSG